MSLRLIDAVSGARDTIPKSSDSRADTGGAGVPELRSGHSATVHVVHQPAVRVPQAPQL